MSDFRHTLFLKIASILWTVVIAKTSFSPDAMNIQVFAGNDTAICRDASLELAELGAIISGDVTDGDWISLGDGYFTPTNSDKARFSTGLMYYPGQNDKAIGQFKLLLISDAPSPNSPNGKVTDEVNITLQSAPALSCSVNVNVSLDENCQQVIIPSMLTTNPVPPYNSYLITLYDENDNLIPNATLTNSHLDQLITYKLGHKCTTNLCWGKIKVEDYFAPLFACKNDTIDCFQSIEPIDLGFPIPVEAIVDTFVQNSWIIKNWDKCSDVTLTMRDSIAKQTCDNAFDKIIYRNWTAKDAKLNTSKCRQVIYITRKTLQDVVFPPHYDGNEKPFFDCFDSFESLENGFPSPDTTGYPLIGFCDNLEFSMTDTKFPMCGNGFKVVRNWFVIEWCTAESTTKNQIIEVRDNSSPEFICPNSVTVSTDAYTCGIEDYHLALPYEILDCSDYSISMTTLQNSEGNQGIIQYINSKFYFNADVPGVYPIEYSVIDICQNQSKCETTLTLVDVIEPNMVCDHHTKVALDDQGRGRLFATTLDDGSNDNCGIKSFEVRKMLNTCGVTPEFNTFIEFCCEDIDMNPQMVELKAIDKYGNFNTCMVEVTVEDKLPPNISCPPDISIECDASIDSLSLIKLGLVRDHPLNIQNITLNNAFHNGIVGQDGLASDNCYVSISLKLNSFVTCHSGYIEKTFTAIDNFNNKNSCTQTIYVINPDPFDESDIIWPPDYQGEGCKAEQILPAISGQPILSNMACGNIASTYSDQAFYIADGACLKIFRTWTVIDWCQFDQDNFSGKWGPHIQTIKMTNTVSPSFSEGCVKDTVVCVFDLNCQEGLVYLPYNALDDCTEDSLLIWNHVIDLHHDGSNDVSITERNIHNSLPIGFHNIKTRVEDQCGNFKECTTHLEVKDCKKPIPYCHSQLTITMTETGYSSEIWAKDFNKDASDNCTSSEDLLFTFEDARPVKSQINNVHFFKGNGIIANEIEYKAGEAQKWNPDSNSSGIIFHCSDISNGVSDTITLDVTIIDNDANSDNCTVELILQDSGDFCDDIITSKSIFGTVKTELGVPISNSIVQCTTPENQSFTTQTNENGQYIFEHLPIDNTYIITSRITDRVVDGVSTLDLLMIQRQILDIAPFTSHFQFLAGDANYSKNITVADLSELRKLLLRINTAFPNGNDPWMCIPKDTVITNTSYPYTVAKYQSVTLTKTYKDSVHFIAIKKGDINNSYINDNHQSLQSRQSKYQTVSVVNSTKNGITYLNFSFEKDLNLDGFQIFINGLEISENYKIESVFDDLEYNIDDTAFLCIAHNKKPIEIKAGNVFLSIPVTHKVLGLNLDSESEIYMNLRSYKLQPILRNSKIGHFTLVNTLVNNNQIQLRCSVDNCPASYSIYNSTGKIVTFGNIDSAGYDDVSEISIPIIPSGIYALKLEYDGIVQSELFVVP